MSGTSVKINDEHNRIWNIAKAYDPKIAEFKLYCKTFYNNDKILTYQVTRGKVELFLTYIFFVRQSQEERKKGVPRGAPQLDYKRANKYKSAPICKGKAKQKQMKSSIVSRNQW